MKAIVTTVGQDQVGIIAGVSQYLAQAHINILDVSQTIMAGYFTMMMAVEVRWRRFYPVSQGIDQPWSYPGG